MIKEFITCAAILDQHGTPHYISKPARHHHIIWWLAGMLHEAGGVLNHKMGYYDACEQGFMTNTGRFVNRVEARQIALNAVQCESTSHDTKLHSEDLW